MSQLDNVKESQITDFGQAERLFSDHNLLTGGDSGDEDLKQFQVNLEVDYNKILPQLDELECLQFIDIIENSNGILREKLERIKKKRKINKEKYHQKRQDLEEQLMDQKKLKKNAILYKQFQQKYGFSNNNSGMYEHGNEEESKNNSIAQIKLNEDILKNNN